MLLLNRRHFNKMKKRINLLIKMENKIKIIKVLHLILKYINNRKILTFKKVESIFRNRIIQLINFNSKILFNK